ncbi:MAG: hypothetical protein SNJ72_02670 [Fimbriimonadales bacterium]
MPFLRQRIVAWSQPSIDLDDDSLSDLLLAEMRLQPEQLGATKGRKRIVKQEELLTCTEQRLRSTMVALPLDDPDILRLLVFCLEMTHQMFEGGTQATVSSKSFREKGRRYEEILLNQFIGRLGEVFVKRYLERKFPNANIQLDWTISPDRSQHTNDIPNAKHMVSIKTSSALAGIWAEADTGSDYGIMVKCVVPQATLLQFFVEVCGYTRLLDFIQSRIPADDQLFKGYIGRIRSRIQQYQCGTIKTHLIGFVLGYFHTKGRTPVDDGTELEYLGAVREKRYFVKLGELCHTEGDWKRFLSDNGLLSDTGVE